MANSGSEPSQSKLTQDLAQRMLEVPKEWHNYLNGKITASQFQQTLANLSDVYAALVAKQKEPSEDLLWKQYELQTELYKHYLDIILKFNAFYYAITGAIISFYFTKPDVPSVRYALLFPILMSIAFAVLFSIGIFLNQVSRKDVFDIRDKLNLNVAPEINVLGALLTLSSLLMFTVAGVLLWFFFPALILYSLLIVLVVFIILWLLFR